MGRFCARSPALSGDADVTAKRSLRSRTDASPKVVTKKQRQEETIMFKNILVPTDGSDLAAKAVEQGVLFAKEIGAKITAMTVTEPFHLLSVSPANSNTRRSNTRSTRRLRPTKCSVSFRLRPSQQVSSAIRFTSNTNSSFRRSSKPPKRESAI